ncbi:DNA polymerase III subunit beta [Deltaproteobacteria bacterium OttesenSCG-928-K17]|nr:DNA polymerase III subunit beta [Deltaproteobacteria bacterium OttesenSCG-928-K17]
MLALKIKKEDLARGVGQTSAIAEKRSSMPILSNILMEAEEGVLKLTATDMEISFQCSYPAEVSEPGRLTVPAKKLNEVVRLLSADEVSLSEAPNFSLSLSAGQFSTQMYGLSPADFPQAQTQEDINYIDVEGPALAAVIDKTIYSVAMEETRYNLSGVYVEKLEHEGELSLRFVSTDGHRLNMAGLVTADLANLELLKGVLISKKGLTELKRLADAAEIVKLGVGSNSLTARTESSVLVMRLLDGRFPDYNMVIPKDNDKHLVPGRKELLDALKRIATMSSDDYKAVKFKAEPGLLTISSMTPELGKAEESLAVEYDGEIMEAGFNPRFFIEALSALVSEKVKISLKDAEKPALLTAAEDPGYNGVIMSMKI